VKSIRPVQCKYREKGDGILETALVILTMTAMIAFVMDIGRVLLTEQFITERARTTAREAVVNSWSADTAANYLVYNSATAPSGSGVGGPPAGFMGLQTSQVTYTALGTPGTPDYRLQIKVSGVPLLVWTPWLAGHYTAPPVVVTMPAQSLGATN
jgi:Flp pilus assembly protein TadG